MKAGILPCVLLLAAPAAMAQNILMVLEDSGPQVVRGLELGRPLILSNGKLVSGNGLNYALQRARAYRMGLVTFSHLGVRSTVQENASAGTVSTYGTDIDAFIHADIPLVHPVLVMEVKSGVDKGLYVNGLDDVPLGAEKKIRISERFQEPLEEKNYALHVFSDGIEVLNSTMDPDYIAAELKKSEELIARQRSETAAPVEMPLSEQPDHGVKLARGVTLEPPAYPADRVPPGLTGTAKVKCEVDPDGKVSSVEVVEATNPEFGTSLATAAKQWTFQAAVKDHQHVASTVVIPFNFKPAAPAGSKP